MTGDKSRGVFGRPLKTSLTTEAQRHREDLFSLVHLFTSSLRLFVSSELRLFFSTPLLKAGEEEDEVVDVDGPVGRAGVSTIVEVDEHVARFEPDEEGEKVFDGDRAVTREAVGKN